MALRGAGAMVFYADLQPGTEADYSAWHAREHIRERVSLPGFLRGRRGEAVEPGSRWFMMYEAATPEVFTSAPYLARLNDPSSWTQRALKTYLRPSRTVFHIAYTAGVGTGVALASFRIATAQGRAEELDGWLAGHALGKALDAPDICGTHLLRAEAALGQVDTAERRLRASQAEGGGAPDRVVLIEGLSIAAVASAAATFGQAEWLARGAARSERTLYLMQHCLAREDI
jgi:hypothetical protein